MLIPKKEAVKKKNLLSIKQIIAIFILVLTLILIGSLYNTLAKHDKMVTVAVDPVFMNHFPDPMPDIVLNPMTNYPLMK